MEKKFKRTTVTSALPYANGPVHIGHLAGVYVPADIYVRYLRLKKEDVIFIGGRLAASYDALTEIAPTVYIATDTELGVVESVRANAANIATMFGLEAEVDELMAAFDERIAALQEVAARPASWAW